MELKQRVGDFRVRELLRPDVLRPSGEFRVYRVIKRKLTSLEAAEALALEAGRAAGDVSMCGLKDRQGITTQFMALERGPEVRLAGTDLRVESVGFAERALDSKDSEGNAFEIVARGLERADIGALRANLAPMRKHGLVNYFDDQRFGNLRHGQGWIALDLMRGELDKALRHLLAGRSLHDQPRVKTLKQALLAHWGDWRECRDIAGKLGAHHSVFEALKREPENLAAAFAHVSSRVRLIHLYAYQSHLWNRAVADLVREHTTPEQRVVLDCEEGPLVYPDDRARLPAGEGAAFRLPGPALEDVADPEQRALLADALAHDRLAPAQFRIDGISGFQIKGEDRPLFVRPLHLRVRPPKPDPMHRGFSQVDVRFELPRGAYATLVVRRLLELPGRASRAAPTWEASERSRPPLEPWRFEGRGRRAPERRRDDRRRDEAPRDGGPREERPWQQRDERPRGSRRPDRGRFERRDGPRRPSRPGPYGDRRGGDRRKKGRHD